MKILLRQWDDKNYSWKKATYKNGHFYCEGLTVYQTNILAISDDNRKDSVACAFCGTLIKNDPESIEAHFAEQEAKRDCLKCRNVTRYVHKILKTESVKNDDGTYNVTETCIANLKCGNTYYNLPDINSEGAKKICTFYRCRNHGVRRIEDIFTQYPDPFEKQIAVDVLLEKGFVSEGYNREFFEYDLKCRNTVKACVNDLGIVDHFIVKHRGYRYKAFYSAKYDKLFFSDNGMDYNLETPHSISENKYNQAKAKISSLYKEAVTNE